MLDTLFMDGLYSDLERMTRINQLIDAVPPAKRKGALMKMRAIDTMVIVPSKDLRAIAYKHRKEMPKPVRALLRGISARNRSDNPLLSFLLFEQAYTQELIELGYNDAMSERDQLLDFVTGKEVPRLFAPDWVTQDLSGFG
jgi:NTE family protein